MLKQKLGSRKDVGLRFRQFRLAIHKTQHELATELRVSQSTIANIESGKAFPNLIYLCHFYYKYRLDTCWLLAGTGEIFMKGNDTSKKYTELLDLMQVPFVSQLIMAKLVELKVLLKDNIDAFFEKKLKDEPNNQQ